MEGLLSTQIYPPGQVSKQKTQTRCPRYMHHASPSICQSDMVPNNRTQEYHRGLPEKDGKDNSGHLHQRQNFQHPTPRMVHAEERAQQASRSKWKQAGQIARLHHARWAQATTMWEPYRDKRSRGRSSTRWADYFNKLVGSQLSKVARDRNEWKKLVGPHLSKVARDRNEWKMLGNQLNAANHSRGLAQRMSL